MSSSGLLGTAVDLAILGVGLSLFTGFANQAQRNLDQGQRRRSRRKTNNYNIYNENQPRQRRQKSRDAYDTDDMFSFNF